MAAPERTVLDNGATWVAKLARTRRVPRAWLLPSALLEKRARVLAATSGSGSRSGSGRLPTSEELRARAGLSGPARSPLFSEGVEADAELVESAGLSGSALAWRAATDAAAGVDLARFAELVVSTGAVTPREAVFMYYASPKPGDEGYAGPASMGLDGDAVDWAAAREVWGMDELAGRLERRQLEAQFEVWRAAAATAVEREARHTRALEERQRVLLAEAPADVSEFVEDEATISLPFSVSEPVEGVRLVSSGLDLFAHARPTRDVPMIKWVPREGDAGGVARPVRVHASLAEVSAATFLAALQVGRVNEEEAQYAGSGALLMVVYARNSAESAGGAEIGQYTIKSRYIVAAIVPASPLLADEDGAAPMTGTVVFRSRSDAARDVLARIEGALGGTRLVFREEEQRTTRISGAFDLALPPPDTRAVALLVAMDPLLRTYFYLEESTYLQTDKRRLALQFRSQGDALIAALGASVADAEGVVAASARSSLTAIVVPLARMQSAAEGGEACAAGCAAIRVRVSRARLPATVTLFTEVLRRALPLLAKRTAGALAAAERALGPELGPRALAAAATLPSMPPRSVAAQPRTAEEIIRARNRELAEAAPDVFVRGYARKCQKNKPRIVDEAEAERLRAAGHQVMLYPPANAPVQPAGGPLLLSCDEYPDAPHPGVSPSPLANADDFPYYPCCFASDQMDPALSTHYNVWAGVRERGARRHHGHIVVTDKALAPGRMGALAPFVGSLLTDDVPEGAELSFVRVGVEGDPTNSLVHAVLVAVGDAAYAAARTPEARIARAAAVRAAWTRAHRARELCAQETAASDYDVGDEGRAFDAALFFRLVEEALNINLFVIAPGEDRLQVPRYLRMHVRPERLARPSVLVAQAPVAAPTRSVIAMNVASAVGAREPAYELVVALGADGRPSVGPVPPALPRGGALLPAWATERLFRALRLAQPVRAWLHPPGRGDILFAGGEQPESRVDLAVAVRALGAVAAQVIDGEGRCRGVVVDPKGGGAAYAIAVWPAQPLDAPAVDAFRLPPPRPAADARAAHGRPAAADVDARGDVVGLWFSAGVLAFYAPVLPEPFDNSLPLGGPSPLPTVEQRAVAWVGEGGWTQAEIARGARGLAVAAQWALWLWCAFRPRDARGDEVGAAEAARAVAQFWRGVARVDAAPAGQHACDYYAPPPLRALPSLRRRDAEPAWAARVAAEVFPSLFFLERGEGSTTLRARAPSEAFIARFGEHLARAVAGAGPAAIAARRTVDGAVPTAAWAAARAPDELVFASDDLFRHWYAEQHRRFATLEASGLGLTAPADARPAVRAAQAARALTVPLVVYSTTPIPLIVDTTPAALAGRTLLIQNVVGGELKRALAVAAAWHAEAVNPGFRTQPLDIPPGAPPPAAVVMEIQADGRLEVADVFDGDSDPLWLLRVHHKSVIWHAAVLILP